MRVLVLAFLAASANGIELVQTPHGLRPNSCVREIPSGTYVEALPDGGLRNTYPNGSTHTFGPCLDAERLNTTIWANWPAMAWGSSSQQQTYFSATYVVPGFPVRHTKGQQQTIHIWIGTEAAAHRDIMQPVLTWNIEKPNDWCIWSWMMIPGGQSQHTGRSCGLRQGDHVQGLIQLDNRCGSNCYYISAKSGSKTQAVQYKGIMGTEIRAVTAVEVWGAEKGDHCGTLPRSEVVFTGLNAQPAQSFSPGTGSPWDASECGWHNRIEGTTWRTGPGGIVV